MFGKIFTIIAADDWITLVSMLHNTGSIPKAPALQMLLACCNVKKQYQYPYQIPIYNVGPCVCGNWFIRYNNLK